MQTGLNPCFGPRQVTVLMRKLKTYLPLQPVVSLNFVSVFLISTGGEKIWSDYFAQQYWCDSGVASLGKKMKAGHSAAYRGVEDLWVCFPLRAGCRGTTDMFGFISLLCWVFSLLIGKHTNRNPSSVPLFTARDFSAAYRKAQQTKPHKEVPLHCTPCE